MKPTITNETLYDDAPLSDSTLAGMRRPPLAKRARLRAGLSQQAFSDAYGIPLGTLRDWEQRRFEPDAAAASYLRAIANDPVAVAAAYNKPAAA
jgi:putative transcriptional regulator